MSSSSGNSRWIVSPAFDLVFLVNAYWPLLLLPGLYPLTGGSEIDFWQVYFLTTPHRWITLLLVALDPDRRGGRGSWFLALAMLAAALVTAAWIGFETLACLLFVDFAWNSWHFASQHAGILRMYARKAGAGRARLERYGLRTIVFYALLRMPHWSTGWTEDWPAAMRAVTLADAAIIGLAALLLSAELLRPTARSIPKLVYLGSVTGLYISLLVCVHFRLADWVLPLAAAATLFHAVEYLAIVTHYSSRRRTQGSASVWQTMSQQWLLHLGVYMLTLGLVAYVADTWLREAWLVVNLWAAYLHYAYDGMIWKLRRPETASVLGLTAQSAAAHAGESDA